MLSPVHQNKKQLKSSASSFQDQHFMQIALSEAVQARGHTSPNPMVGAVLIRNGKILAQGYHHRAGLPHAEIEALRQVSNPKKATLYVTLEPCCHEGKRTPPCVEAILQAKIQRVVVGTLDPNPKVAGRGITQLRRAGLRVDVGVLETECREINRFYNHWIQTQEPYVVLKMASSLDGRIALASGKSKWITSESSRKKVHELRAEVDAILAGVGTILHDDSELNVRLTGNFKQPRRVILDPKLEIPLKARVLKDPQNTSIIITTKPYQNSARAKALQKKGVEIWIAPQKTPGFFDLKKILKTLGKQGISSLMVEGGSHTWSSFLEQNAAHEIQCFFAPFFIGSDGRPSIQALGLKKIPQSNWKLKSFEKYEEDIHLCYQKDFK